MSTSTLKQLDPTQVELEFGIPADGSRAGARAAFRELSRNVRIPGFRPGKVPRKVFEAPTARPASRSARSMTARRQRTSARSKSTRRARGAGPRSNSFPEEEAADVRIKATVAVRPAIVLGDYRAIEVGRSTRGSGERVDAQPRVAAAGLGGHSCRSTGPSRRATWLPSTLPGRSTASPFEGGTAQQPSYRGESKTASFRASPPGSSA